MTENASLKRNRGLLSDATKTFNSRILKSQLVELDELKKVVGSLLAQDRDVDPESIIKAAIGAGMLTRWQGKQLLAGHCDGFFLGSYKLLKPLGAGGMGVVYLAEHKVMQRRIALKVLPAAATQDKARVARFQAEARAAAQLDHPNIVPAYDFGEAGGKAFIVTEYVEGMDLHQLVARDGVMSFRAAVEVLMQAADGLAHAHRRGIIHRGIKPANLILRQDGVVKISDMGLRQIGYQSGSNLTSAGGGVMGTSGFLAPEQALDSHSVDGRADIYGLGCTLYYLLTQQSPCPGKPLAAGIADHHAAAPVDIRDLRPACPAALAQLAMRMMAKQPADRVPTCNDLLIILRRLATSGTLGADPGLSALIGSREQPGDGTAADQTATASIAPAWQADDIADWMSDFDEIETAERITRIRGTGCDKPASDKPASDKAASNEPVSDKVASDKAASDKTSRAARESSSATADASARAAPRRTARPAGKPTPQRSRSREGWSVPSLSGMVLAGDAAERGKLILASLLLVAAVAWFLGAYVYFGEDDVYRQVKQLDS